MKVILNKCYGGFDVSYKGHQLYAEKKNLPLYAYILDYEKAGHYKKINEVIDNNFRYMYFTKDLNILSINTNLFEKLDNTSLNKIKKQMLNDLENYFKDLGGLYQNDSLIWFAKSKKNVEYIISKEKSLMVADSSGDVTPYASSEESVTTSAKNSHNDPYTRNIK